MKKFNKNPKNQLSGLRYELEVLDFVKFRGSNFTISAVVISLFLFLCYAAESANRYLCEGWFETFALIHFLDPGGLNRFKDFFVRPVGIIIKLL